MAKRKGSARIVRYVKAKARRAKGLMGSLGEPVKFAAAGVVYAVAGAVVQMVPVISGLPALVKKAIVLLGLYLAGGIFRKAAYIGIGVETAAYAMPLISSMIGGLSGNAAMIATSVSGN